MFLVFAGIQISPSLDCALNEYCCYTQAPTVIAPSPSGCIPYTNPAVSNGTCVDASQLATVCRGSQIATSLNCQVTQFCCFGGASGLPALTTTSTSVAPTTATTAYVSAAPLATTVATTNPTTTVTTTTTTAKTTTVAPMTYVATPYPYRQQPGGLGYVPSEPQPANRSCSPQSNRQIQNGVCVSSMKISQACQGIQISPSLDCTGDEYCCYQSPVVMDLRPGKH